MKPLVKVVRPLRNGQITIPSEFRARLEINEHSLLELALVGDELRLKPLHVSRAKNSEWARELYELFAPVRTETAKQSEKQVNADIDKAVAAVRRKRRARRA
ncbi:MAG: AbrB/MazE/SpoVT family DNA-binding domain-containing protein [Chloroflexota bacterium]|nr:MAG: AbrB/MazE/SpoVT family DNA-binding domain-containing protein [Chloroflexota bacterium]